MADLNRSGQVQNLEQIRADRRRKGLCETCRIDPVQCYQIKKRFGGLTREKIPLTQPGRVFNGICLDCNPDQDPDGPRTHNRTDRDRHRHRRDDPHRHRHHHRHSQPYPPHHHQYNAQDPRAVGVGNNNGGKSAAATNRDDGYTRASSLPDDWLKNLGQSLPADLQNLQEDSMNYLDLYNDGIEYEDDQYERQQQHQHKEEEGYEYVEETNMFGEKIMVHKPKHRLRKERSSKKSRRPTGPGSGGKQDIPIHTDKDTCGQRSDERLHRSTEDEEEKNPPGLPSLPGKKFDPNASGGSLESEEPLDALAQLCAQHMKKNNQPVKFDPASKTVLPNTELELQEIGDDATVLSGLTLDTFFQGRNSIATKATRKSSRRDMFSLDAINEASRVSEGSDSAAEASTGPQRSIMSRQIREPAVPNAVDEASNTQDMNKYIEETAPHLMTLRDIVDEIIQVGEDSVAIDVITQALIHDNATSMSQDLALFALTTLWVLVRKSDDNKRKIIFEDATFDVIIEAMQIYRESSAEIQTRGCGVLWSLSMEPNDRKHVAQLGGCEAILNAMLIHIDVDALQVMALGALKVLSFDNIGKTTLRSRGALSTVGDVMKKHLNNPTIQSEGCVILGNLSVDAASQSVVPVSEKEIDVIFKAMLAHPDSLEVHESA